MNLFKKGQRFLFQAITVLILIVVSQGAIASESLTINPLAPPNTQSPQATLSEFLNQTNAAYHLLMEAVEQSNQEGGLFHSQAVIQKGVRVEELMERAIRTLNLTEVPVTNQERVGLESALRLKEILDRISLPPISQVPDADAVKANNLTRWEIPGTEVTIAKVSEGRYNGEFLFSSDTVQHLKTFYAEALPMPYQPGATRNFYTLYISTPGQLLPPKWSNWLPDWTKVLFWEQTIWQWVILLVAILVAIAIIRLLAQLQNRQLSHQIDTKAPTSALTKLGLPFVTALVLLALRYFADQWINITGDIDEFFSLITTALLFIVAAWFAFLLIDFIASEIVTLPKITAKGIDASLIRTLLKLLGGIIAATILYFGAQQLGIPVAPLIASFGAVGLAISFGAQEYFKNVVGGLTLFIDRPVSVGDFCEAGGVIGTVEEIGLRSTRIRTLDLKLVSVPNSTFSNAQLVNYSKRDRWLFQMTIGLIYETTRAQLETILTNIRAYLEVEPLATNSRVRFVKLGDYSLDIEVFTFILTTNYATYLDFQEKLLLEVMRIVEQAGTDFAYPSQTLYISRDTQAQLLNGENSRTESFSPINNPPDNR